MYNFISTTFLESIVKICSHIYEFMYSANESFDALIYKTGRKLDYIMISVVLVWIVLV